MGGENDHAFKVYKAVVHRGNAFQIQVVCGSVQKQHVGVEQHHPGKHAPHFFAARQHLDRLVDIVSGEEHSAQEAPEEGFGFIGGGVLADPFQDGVIIVIEIGGVIHREVGG